MDKRPLYIITRGELIVHNHSPNIISFPPNLISFPPRAITTTYNIESIPHYQFCAGMNHASGFSAAASGWKWA